MRRLYASSFHCFNLCMMASTGFYHFFFLSICYIEPLSNFRSWQSLKLQRKVVISHFEFKSTACPLLVKKCSLREYPPPPPPPPPPFPPPPPHSTGTHDAVFPTFFLYVSEPQRKTSGEIISTGYPLSSSPHSLQALRSRRVCMHSDLVSLLLPHPPCVCLHPPPGPTYPWADLIYTKPTSVLVCVCVPVCVHCVCVCIICALCVCVYMCL